MTTTAINATPDTVRAVSETLEFAALLDDRVGHSDKARIAAWSEQAQRHCLTRDDLMDGLQDFYDHNDTPINIGGLIQYARSRKRARLERESDTERETRRAQLDAKIDENDETPSLPLGLPMGPVKHETARLQAARDALDACYGKQASRQAIREYFDARREAVQLAKAAPPKGRQQITIAAASAALTVECPWETCRAKVGSPCLLDGEIRAVPHPSRIEAAQAGVQR